MDFSSKHLMLPFTRTQIKNLTRSYSFLLFNIFFAIIYHATQLITEKLLHADFAKKTIYRCFLAKKTWNSVDFLIVFLDTGSTLSP